MNFKENAKIYQLKCSGQNHPKIDNLLLLIADVLHSPLFVSLSVNIHHPHTQTKHAG